MATASTSKNADRNSSGTHWRAAHFAKFAQLTSAWTGHPTAFLLAVAVVIVWILTGPLFDYSDTWQLVINTGTTIVTFLMVFLIQNTQNRDMMSMQLKLSELVLAMEGAKNKFASIEDLTDEELEELHEESRRRTEIACKHLETRRGHLGELIAAHRASKDKTKIERAKPAHRKPARKSAEA
ncbi:MAG TPA: low affinity iron permease family protein [Pseudolabrys sp.]|nr:low affinity iron permease family protein [Pseudolabrys sp.]